MIQFMNLNRNKHSVPSTRRLGTFSAIIQRVYECCIGGMDDSDDEAVGNEVAVATENSPTMNEREGLSSGGRIWNVFLFISF